MARGPKKHLKRLAAPSHWMLNKITGHYAPRPSPGPHKLRECLPLAILLRNRLKYALTYQETKLIVMQRLVKVDGKVRTDQCYPAGFMDVVSLEKTQQHFRLLLDTKGRFVPRPISAEEASYKLCRVKKVLIGPKAIPMLVTHDARTIRFPHPNIKVHDTIRLSIADSKIVDTYKFEVGNVAMVTGGHNVGRVGTIVNRERHLGSFDIVHLRDSRGNEFATRISNVFVIGKGEKPMVSLPKDKGIRLTIFEDRQLKLKKNAGL
ncbi:Component of cytosolic 80S ribosome and 40S small subunit, related [Eimeria tenella]|uniref:40S ribosomal protein S4 n=1 Tax=Eimeria tenella TaxID=5802 RepID=H9B9F5_EIMTE|nr:Component of cytosolic 80S ribosome and 40S small subunit, related [Eimeria tenella]AET50615.1 hypothetical protein [Eimeria tenella]CDJ37662.1 Component of cytosolic 80S ribosome and 40S small subunit, related [Eimeria tenella]|eukprot:XP_013228500.1 Component of cytosolic 80S ribosome and 40S small subunit, related [Eimeria tenella]